MENPNRISREELRAKMKEYEYRELAAELTEKLYDYDKNFDWKNFDWLSRAPVRVRIKHGDITIHADSFSTYTEEELNAKPWMRRKDPDKK